LSAEVTSTTKLGIVEKKATKNKETTNSFHFKNFEILLIASTKILLDQNSPKKEIKKTKILIIIPTMLFQKIKNIINDSTS
jgi:hypothetical protein